MPVSCRTMPVRARRSCWPPFQTRRRWRSHFRPVRRPQQSLKSAPQTKAVSGSNWSNRIKRIQATTVTLWSCADVTGGNNNNIPVSMSSSRRMVGFVVLMLLKVVFWQVLPHNMPLPSSLILSHYYVLDLIKKGTAPIRIHSDLYEVIVLNKRRINWNIYFMIKVFVEFIFLHLTLCYLIRVPNSEMSVMMWSPSIFSVGCAFDKPVREYLDRPDAKDTWSHLYSCSVKTLLLSTII